MAQLRAAVDALRSLGTAGSVEAFANHEELIRWLYEYLQAAENASLLAITPSQAQLFEQGLISWLSAAVSRAFFLMQLSIVSAKAIGSIANLCSVMGLSAALWRFRDVPAAQLQTDRLHVAQQVAKTGLLTSLAYMCSAVAHYPLELVGGKSCICAGCKVARYCGKDCQVAHWKAHKRVCKQLRAAAAAPQ